MELGSFVDDLPINSWCFPPPWLGVPSILTVVYNQVISMVLALRAVILGYYRPMKNPHDEPLFSMGSSCRLTMKKWKLVLLNHGSPAFAHI